MPSFSDSIKLEKRQWIATIVTSIVFLFFWIYGPLKSVIEPFLSNEKTEHFVKPVLISSADKKNYSSSKSIGNFKSKGEGYSLITEKEKEEIDHKILIFETNVVSDTEYGNELLQNAKRITKSANAKYTLKQTENLFYTDIEENGKSLIYLQSKTLTNKINGYSGPLNIGLLITEQGNIKQCRLISSNETKSYLKKIAETHFYHQFENKSIEEIHTIDAISGATITTKAIALTASELVHIGNPSPISELTDQIGISNFMITAKLTFTWIIQILIIGLLFLYSYQKKFRKSKRFVLLTSIASVTYIGFFLNDSFTYITFLHPFIGTSISSFIGLYAFFVLLGAIWGKNTYCKYICPYGNIQRLQLKLTKGLNMKFIIKNKSIKQIRFSILFLLVVGILAGYRNLSHLEPYPYIFGLEVQSIWFFMFAILGLLMNWVYPMIWCRLLCPTGSILDTISQITTKK